MGKIIIPNNTIATLNPVRRITDKIKGVDVRGVDSFGNRVTDPQTIVKLEIDIIFGVDNTDTIGVFFAANATRQDVADALVHLGNEVGKSHKK